MSTEQPKSIEIRDQRRVKFVLPNCKVIECVIREGKLRVSTGGEQMTIQPGGSTTAYVSAEFYEESGL